MKFNYHPKSKLEKFGEKIYNLLVDNFPQTFFVGGMVRDLLLGKTITDIDIATSALPDEVVKVLSSHNIITDAKYKQFGTILATQGSMQLEITTLRKDLASTGRYNKVSFIKSAKIDSQRRDFTINSFYLRLNNGKIFDYQNGFSALKKKQIKFISSPDKRIKQDPLRIIRALRFALVLNFKLESKTKQAIQNYFYLIETITSARKEKEINKIKSPEQKKILKKVINNPAYLDKYFK